MTTLIAIVLAAGQGTRMKSERAKVLFTLAGKPMLHHVLDAAFAAGASRAIVVVGFDGDNVKASLASFGERVTTVVQSERLGTGHAVGCALTALRTKGDAFALVLCGDTPRVRPGDLERLTVALMSGPSSAQMSMLTCVVPDPTGYGRVLRDQSGQIRAIREQKDASEEERHGSEVNPAMYVVRGAFLKQAIAALEPNNAQGELYFTDVVARAAADGGVLGVSCDAPETLVGINDRAQLFTAEQALYADNADRLRRAGVTVRGEVRVDSGVVVEADATLEPGVVLRGATVVRARAHIDVGSVLTDVIVGEGARVLPYTVATRSTIGRGANVGPFSHLRPESQIDDEAHIGNFVETKKTRVRRGAKANHLAYLGDGDVGEGANIGAGTIFCNYDGVNKHRTEIGARAFIGSDTQIVAPVKIGEGAIVSAGTTVTRDVPADALAISRVPQENKEGYAPRLRARLQAKKG